MSMPRIHLVGAGPGNPDLLTVKALRLIQQAEIVVHDRLVPQDILDLIPQSARRIFVGKATRNHSMAQEDINLMLVELARDGKRVVRLKGGDPFIFGRGSEEALTLAEHGIPFEIVPGVTAAAGCGAYAGIPLTHRGLATGVRFVTGHCRKDNELVCDWLGMTDPDTTLVFYMALANLETIRRNLIAAGVNPAMPAAAVSCGTTAAQRSVFATLGTLERALALQPLPAPCLIIVGRVVALAPELAWYGERELTDA
jgi:uroporphyrin-III C-methyltransferase